MEAHVDSEITYERGGGIWCLKHDVELLSDEVYLRYGTPSPTEYGALRELAPNARDHVVGGCLTPPGDAKQSVKVLYCSECRRVLAEQGDAVRRRARQGFGDASVRWSAPLEDRLEQGDRDAAAEGPSGFSLPLTWMLLAAIITIVLLVW